MFFLYLCKVLAACRFFILVYCYCFFIKCYFGEFLAQCYIGYYRNELVCDTNYGKSGNRKLSYINIHEFYKVKQSSGMNGECLYIYFFMHVEWNKLHNNIITGI